VEVKEKRWQQFIPRKIEEIWDFFSRPENLNDMTPNDMSFEILTDVSGVRMYPGMLIRYRISPFAGIKMSWVTEITHIEEGRYFIDEQRFGPYAFWHHQHHFEPRDGGVLMTDILHYKVPYGPIGNLANLILVEPKVDQIFRFRVAAVEKHFPSLPG